MLPCGRLFLKTLVFPFGRQEKQLVYLCVRGLVCCGCAWCVRGVSVVLVCCVCARGVSVGVSVLTLAFQGGRGGFWQIYFWCRKRGYANADMRGY